MRFFLSALINIVFLVSLPAKEKKDGKSSGIRPDQIPVSAKIVPADRTTTEIKATPDAKDKEGKKTEIYPKTITEPSPPPPEAEPEEKGNVEVTLVNGKKELWTKLGKARLPKVATNGLVGWTWEEQKNNGTEVNSILRIMKRGKLVANLSSGKPFIQNWAFSEKDDTVVIKSKATQGNVLIERFSLGSGKLIGKVDTSGKKFKIPRWAKPFLEQN